MSALFGVFLIKFPVSPLQIGHIDPGNDIIALASAQAKIWLGQRMGNILIYAQYFRFLYPGT